MESQRKNRKQRKPKDGTRQPTRNKGGVQSTAQENRKNGGQLKDLKLRN